MRISNFLIAASTAAALLGAGTAGAVPAADSLAITAHVGNTTTDLRTISGFALNTVSWGAESGGFTQLGAARTASSLGATNLALNHITGFSLAGTTLSVLGRSFGTFNATSYTTIVSTRSAATYAVFGTYGETFAAGLVGAGSPNAEIVFSFSIPSNRDRCEDDEGCAIGVSATLIPYAALVTTTAAVPEPAGFALLGVGLAGLGAVRRRRAA